MEKELKDYLHLYLGCKGRVSIDYGVPFRGMKIVDCDLIGIVGEIVTLECYDINGNKWPTEHICRFDKFKLILHPLSDITVEEKYKAQFKAQCFFLEELHPLGAQVPTIEQAAIVVNELRKLHFDCDGLIEAGLAIDSSKLTK